MQMQLSLGTNMKMQLEKKKGSRLELLARKKGVRAVHSEQTERASFSGSRVSRRALRLLWPTEYLTIIPRARIGSESIAHEAEGRMDY